MNLSGMTLNHLLTSAENEAALALRESTQALVECGNAYAAVRDGTGTVKAAVEAEEFFNKKLAARILADAKVDYLRKQAGVR